MSAIYPNPELVRHNVAIPYKGPLSGFLKPGRLIEVRGDIHSGAKRFHVNLLDDRGEIALHVNPRFDSKEVVLNSFRGGKWEVEVKGPYFPFHHNQPFVIVILVEPMEYKVALNGKHFASFPHRKLFTTVNMIEIGGPHITVNRLEERMEPLRLASGDFVAPSAPPATMMPGVPNYTAPSAFPMPGPPPMAVTVQSGYAPGTRFINPPMPFAAPIPGGLRAGMVVAISGRPHTIPHRFSINFQSGPNDKNTGDIAFHLNPRFDTSAIVRNAMFNGNWESEERQSPRFPFRPGVHFDMLIQVTPDRFNVAVDGQHMIEFKHRHLPLNRFNFLSIEGDVVLACVAFQ